MILEPHWKHTYGLCRRLGLIALLLGSLTSCSTTSIAPLPVERVLPEQACLKEADPLPTLTDPTYPALILLLVDVADSYHILAARHRCLADFLR